MADIKQQNSQQWLSYEGSEDTYTLQDSIPSHIFPSVGNIVAVNLPDTRDAKKARLHTVKGLLVVKSTIPCHLVMEE